MPFQSDLVTKVPEVLFQTAHSGGGSVSIRSSAETLFRSHNSSPSLKNGDASGAALQRTTPALSKPFQTNRLSGAFHATISDAEQAAARG